MESLNAFSNIVTSVFLESALFLMLGALISALIEHYVDTDKIYHKLPKTVAGQLALGLFSGFLLPTCECGIVLVVRKLLQKKIPVTTAIAFMLTAPGTNPIVLASTYVAFQGDLTMVLGRLVLIWIPAIMTALLLGKIPVGTLLKQGHVHSHHSCCHHHHSENTTLKILRHSGEEFMSMAKYLILGAMAVALFRLYLPAGLMTAFSESIFLSIGFMMLLAFVLSICSEADAFVANGFSFMPKMAQLSFIAIGPMVDIKLILMYGALFHRRVVWVICFLPTIIIYILSVSYAFLTAGGF